MQQNDGGSGEMDGGEKGSTEPHFVIMRETPNQQSKNRVTYDYRTLTTYTTVLIMRSRGRELQIMEID